MFGDHQLRGDVRSHSITLGDYITLGAWTQYDMSLHLDSKASQGRGDFIRSLPSRSSDRGTPHKRALRNYRRCKQQQRFNLLHIKARRKILQNDLVYLIIKKTEDFRIGIVRTIVAE